MRIKSSDFLLRLWFDVVRLTGALRGFYYLSHLGADRVLLVLGNAVQWCPEYSLGLQCRMLTYLIVAEGSSHDAGRPYAFDFKVIWVVILYIPHLVGGFVIPVKFPDQNSLCIFHFPINITADAARLIRMYLVATRQII
jgi:hypothetical protein